MHGKRVLLINPPFTQPKESKKRCLVPMGIAYISGYLKKHGYDTDILDCLVEGYDYEIFHEDSMTFGLSPKRIKKYIEDYKPTHVGISCLMTSQESNALSVAELCKFIDKNIHVTIGGGHPSVFPEKFIDNKFIDAVVVGEGELSMLQIVDDNLTGIIKNSPIDINEIPWPDRDSLPMEKYFEINMPENIFSSNKRVVQVLTSRGCPFKCVFCCTTNIHGYWRGRSPYDVVREILYLKDKYNIDEVNFIDENLVLDNDRATKIFDSLIGQNLKWSNPGGIWVDGLDEDLLTLMKYSGCYQLTFPVESSSKRILKNVINKPLNVDKVPKLVDLCHRLGIDVHAFFVEGFPEQTKDDMIDDYKFAKKCKFDSASFHIITPLPGSRLYDEYKDVVDIDRINYIHSTIPHPTLTSDEIEQIVYAMNVQFNKGYKWRHPLRFLYKYKWIPYKKGFNKPFQRV